MLSEIEMVLAALDHARVRYLVVGSVAVVLHGRLRIAAEADLEVQVERASIERALSVLERIGFRPRAPMSSLWNPAHPGFEVDVSVYEPFGFEALYGRAVRAQALSSHALIPAIDDLIAMKRAEGRAQGLDDAAALQSLRDSAGSTPSGDPDDGFDRGWEGHARRQATIGLALTPAERLRWLEETMATMRRWLGRAEESRPTHDE
jgi:hypothetical protein